MEMERTQVASGLWRTLEADDVGSEFVEDSLVRLEGVPSVERRHHERVHGRVSRKMMKKLQLLTGCTAAASLSRSEHKEGDDMISPDRSPSLNSAALTTFHVMMRIVATGVSSTDCLQCCPWPLLLCVANGHNNLDEDVLGHPLLCYILAPIGQRAEDEDGVSPSIRIGRRRIPFSILPTS